jgi:polyisoprenoid-binding protein YceI
MTYIVVKKDPSTMAAGLSHDHAIRAKGISGSFTWNAADPAACRLKVLMPVNQLDVDAPETRKAAGLEGTLSDGQRKDVRKNMLAKGQLYANNFPTISFQSDGCSLNEERFAVQGDLTIRGKAQRVILRGSLSAEDAAFRLRGFVNIKATDFGFEPYTALLGQLKNQNEMKLVVDLRGTAG